MQKLNFTPNNSELIEFIKSKTKIKVFSDEEGIHIQSRPKMLINSKDSSWIISAIGDTFRCDSIEFRFPGSLIFYYHGYQCFSIIT